MNIKSPAAEQVVRELAEATGESLTEAIMIAAAERLERVRARNEVTPLERVIEMIERNRARLTDEQRSLDPFDDMYDDDGLPA